MSRQHALCRRPTRALGSYISIRGGVRRAAIYAVVAVELEVFAAVITHTQSVSLFLVGGWVSLDKTRFHAGRTS
jgi:hypothetical protein